MIKLPKKVKIGGVVYDVEFPYVHDDDIYCGTHDYQLCKIRIENSWKGRKYSDWRIFDIFIHECLHAIDLVYCNSSLGEKFINRMSINFVSFLRDNKIILNKIPSKLKILFTDFRVIYPYTFDNIENCPSHKVDSTSCKILLANKRSKKEVFNEDVIFVNLISAAIQAIVEISDTSSEEMYSMTSLGNGIFQFLKDNDILELVDNLKKNK